MSYESGLSGFPNKNLVYTKMHRWLSVLVVVVVVGVVLVGVVVGVVAD